MSEHDTNNPSPRTALAAVLATEPERLEVTLLSGARAQILRNAKGKHVLLAARMAGGQSAGPEYLMALVAVKARYNGRDLQKEDVEELPDCDVWQLINYCLIPADKLAEGLESAAEAEARPKVVTPDVH